MTPVCGQRLISIIKFTRAHIYNPPPRMFERIDTDAVDVFARAAAAARDGRARFNNEDWTLQADRGDP